MRDWLAVRAGATPTATAVADGSTYNDLNETVESLAGRLAACGVGVQDTLAVSLPTRPAFFRCVHAAQRVGAVLVPLDPRLTADEMRRRLDRVDPTAVVCGSPSESTVFDAVAPMPADPTVVSVDDSTAEATPLSRIDPESFDLPEWELEEPLVVPFTSGTTGEPSGVVLTLGNVLAGATASAFRLGLRPDDCWHVPLPMCHLGGLAPVYRSVLYGTTISVERGDFSPESTIEQLEGSDATCVSLVPTMLRRLLDAGGETTLSDLRFVLLGGAGCPPELLERAQDLGVPVAPTYGMTETASQIATARPTEAESTPGSVGHPLMFAEVRVVDETGGIADTGESGEIFVEGPMVTPGYLDEDRTAAAFGPRGFRTGDRGHRDSDGRLWVHGRVDDRIVTGGEVVDPAEVTAVLREHRAVEDAAVIGLSDDEWGERVAAAVTGSADLDTEALYDHCRDRLADYKRPKELVVIAEIPRTASGTVDRQALEAVFDPE
ncbi:MAG: AMP-binding protein [Natronomonas sp.]